MKFPDTYDELNGHALTYRRQQSSWKLSLAKWVFTTILVFGSLFYMYPGIYFHLVSSLSPTQQGCALHDETPPGAAKRWFLTGYADIGCGKVLSITSGTNGTQCNNLGEGITSLSLSWVDSSASFEVDLFDEADCVSSVLNLTGTTLCSPVTWVSYLVKAANSTKSLPP